MTPLRNFLKKSATIGMTVFLSQSVFAMRIVSLAPNMTEILFSLGLQKSIVGITKQCDYPIQTHHLKKIGSYIAPNEELIFYLQPDAVIATEGNPRSVVDNLKKKGLPVLEENPKSIPSLLQTIFRLGKTFNRTKTAALLAQKISKQYEIYKKMRPGQNKSFLLVLQTDPLFSVSQNTWLSQMFEDGGYHNILHQKYPLYPVINREFLLTHKPDTIFIAASGEYQGRMMKNRIQDLLGHPQKQKIIILPQDIFSRVGPRLTQAWEFLEKNTIVPQAQTPARHHYS